MYKRLQLTITVFRRFKWSEAKWWLYLNTYIQLSISVFVHFFNFFPSLYLLIFGFVWWIKLATITFERALNLEAYHIVASTCTPMGVFTRESSLRALVCDIDLPRYTSSLMDRFRRGEGRRRADLHKWGLKRLPLNAASNRPWTTLSTRAR